MELAAAVAFAMRSSGPDDTRLYRERSCWIGWGTGDVDLGGVAQVLPAPVLRPG